MSSDPKASEEVDLSKLSISSDNKEPQNKPKSNKSNKSSNKKPKAPKAPKAPAAPPREWTTSLQSDLDRILSVGEECISPPELKSLLLAKGRDSSSATKINLYDGFEPSGRMHIAQGVFKAMNVNKCTHEGTNSKFTFWVADWFALMNDKMGGDLDKIKTVGEYLIEVWKAAGMNLEHVEFKWASEEITNLAGVYWPKMLDVARRFNVTRIKKCCQIMGRKEGSLSSAQVLYPLMQCTDVFFLKADICQLGVDQRKVNMLAREYCIAAGIKRKPVILSHHMLYGLKAGQEKMSKSDPDSAIFMEDSAEDVERKIMAAYCPSKEEQVEEEVKEEINDTTTTNNNNNNNDDANEAQETKDAGDESMHLTKDTLKNPCLDYIQNIILSPPDATFTANDKTYSDFESIKSDFLSGVITEQQLKRGLIHELNKLLEPVRDHFTNDTNAKELLEKVTLYKKQTAGGLRTERKELRRLDLASTETVLPDSHVVFAPLPSPTPTLQSAYDTLARLRSSTTSTSPKVLYLPDWTARVCNKCDADVKAIDAYYTILLTSLRSLSPELMSQVTVLRQSEAILKDPSNYWISVINVGRHYTLAEVMGENVEDKDGVGIVIGRLMNIADVMGLNPKSIGYDAEDVDAAVERRLVEGYFASPVLEGKLSPPEFEGVKSPSLLLQQRELEAHKTENDEYYLLDDPKVHGKSKMKKAFCEPGNVDFCPPIVLSMAFGPGEIVIERSEDNGGNITFKSREEMEVEFKEERLHPGDLKAASIKIMVGVLEKLAKGIKGDGDATKAAKALKAFVKKMSKKKK